MRGLKLDSWTPFYLHHIELDDAKVEAKFRDGVLELTLPKKAAAARKAITIQ